jgi:putative flippase GtrA
MSLAQICIIDVNMEPVAAIDPKEFGRFVISGLMSTLGNFAGVWLFRLFAPFDTALLAGIVVGVITSFILSKVFAFDARGRTLPQAIRFLVVYAIGCGIYWLGAMVVARAKVLQALGGNADEMAGVVAGAALMMVVSYFGHRFFTYRSYRGGRGARGGYIEQSPADG